DGFFLASQQRGILAQLGAGIRALLIDFHYGWVPIGGVVRTDVLSETNRGSGDDPELNAAQQATVSRLLGMAGAAPPPEQHRVYLCHVTCELGATRATSALEEIASFLRENPNEVLLILVEDHVQPKDAVRVFEDSGLAKRAWVWERGTRLPTLREMIESRHNVLVMAEFGGGAAPWYHAGFEDLLVETQYRFESIAELSCATNRGDREHPLFLLNHWITTGGAPSLSTARAMNDADLLGARARQCAAQVGQPNIVAVDFHATGDLKKVVATLNKVGSVPVSESVAGPKAEDSVVDDGGGGARQ
ncbi:MAG TPA: hypothetical protein VF855_05545, partial [Acidimicrobiales bacterium]